MLLYHVFFRLSFYAWYTIHRESYPSSLNRLANVCFHKQYSTGKRFYLPTKLQFSIIQYKPKNFLFSLHGNYIQFCHWATLLWYLHCQIYTNEIAICLCEINHMVNWDEAAIIRKFLGKMQYDTISPTKWEWWKYKRWLNKAHWIHFASIVLVLLFYGINIESHTKTSPLNRVISLEFCLIFRNQWKTG